MFWWNGISSDDMGVYVEHYPNLPRPAKKIERVSIPGRNGDLLLTQKDVFENVIQPYDVFISAEQRKNLPQIARRVCEWLYAPDGYARLEDSYDLDCFREAHFSSAFDIENSLNTHGRATLEFDCKPQRFFKFGDEEIALGHSSIESVKTLVNPSRFGACPIFDFQGTANSKVRLSWGNTIVDVQFPPGKTSMFLNVEEMILFAGGVQNEYMDIILPMNPFGMGETIVRTRVISGSVSSITIRPRWWNI